MMNQPPRAGDTKPERQWSVTVGEWDNDFTLLPQEAAATYFSPKSAKGLEVAMGSAGSADMQTEGEGVDTCSPHPSTFTMAQTIYNASSH